MFVQYETTDNWSKMDYLLEVVDREYDIIRPHKTRNLGVSGYKGVYSVSNGKWRVLVYSGKKQLYLGLYNSPFEAAVSYDRFVVKYFGFTRGLNFTRAFHESML